MPRKPRDVKSAAPSPSPARSVKSRTRSKTASTPEDPAPIQETPEEDGVDEAGEDDEDTAAEPENGLSEAVEDTEGEAEVSGSSESEKGKGKVSMADRMAKLKDLRVRMNQSSAENRKDLIADHQKSKVTAKELQRLEKQRKLAQTLRLKAEAEVNGEDLERKKNWEWSIEENERWEAKLEEQKIRGDSNFHNAEDDAHKRYSKYIRGTKPDLLAYERQKEAALGLAPGTLVPAGATSASLVASSSASRGLTAAEDLYRGANTLAYGDSKPSEDAIDRVVGKINEGLGKAKRRKKEDDDDEITYINERNKVFNKKISRYFDKYTKEIRANLERGTAL